MKTVVLLSGGIDSTVLLVDRIRRGDECYTVTFDYGQRNRVRELEAAGSIADHYGIGNRLVVLPPQIFGASALLGDGNIPDGHAQAPDATVVTGRNLVFLACATAIAETLGAATVLYGANYEDRGGYKDCRPEFLQHVEEATYYASGVRVAAPFMFTDKADIVALGLELCVPLDLTWSCYRAGNLPCGRCGACEQRQAAWTCT